MTANETTGGGAERPVHVMLLPSWYPTEREPVNGVFFREQAQALLRHEGLKVGVVAPILRGVRTFREGGLAGYRFQTEERVEEGVPTLQAMGWSIPKAPAANRRLWMALARRMAERYAARYGRPDIIHVHSTLSAGDAAQAIGRAWNVPYVLTEHTTLFLEKRIDEWRRPVIRQALEGAARALAVSGPLAAELGTYAPGTPVQVVPNMVDTDFFAAPPSPRLPGGPFRMLNVALLSPVKGVDVLLRAFAQSFRGREDVVLEIGGSGPSDGELHALAEELGIAGQVRFLGMLTREGVREAMWRADAFVLPSLVETFGVVVIEALSTGLPVVATVCGGPEDILVPQTGRLVTAGDVEGLAAAMREMEADREQWRLAGPEIRADTVRRFSQQVIAGRLASLYREVLREHAGKSAR